MLIQHQLYQMQRKRKYLQMIIPSINFRLYNLWNKEKVIANLNKYEKAKDTFDIDPVYAIRLYERVLGDIGDNFDYYETAIEMNFKLKAINLL